MHPIRQVLLVAGLTSLLVSCKKEEEAAPRPVANFTPAGGDCTAPCQVSFTNASQHATSYAWNFGDGATATEASPNHTYQAGGTFTVSLIAISRQGTDTTTHALIIQQAPAAPLAAFTVAGGDCTAPCQVSFTNASQHATSYAWNFGDGATATEASPNHTYQAGGTFTVSLIATGPGGSHTLQQPVTIAHTAPVADFSFTGGDCSAPCQVSFTNASRHATTYQWDFGDGTLTSEANPVHQFSDAGTYQVSLRVTGTGGSHSVTKPVSITQDATPVSVTPTELLCSQTWILTGMMVNSQDEFVTMLECDKDNQITFDRNGSYVLDEGPKSCTPSSSQTTSGTWSLGEVNGQSSLTLTEGDVSQTTTIVELTPTTMVLRHDDDSGPSPTTIIVTYSHPRQ